MEVFFIFFGCHVRAILGPKEDQVPQRNPKAAKPKPPLSMTYRQDSFTVRGAARSPIEYLCWDSSIWTSDPSEFVLNFWSNSPCIDPSRPSTESYWIYRTYTYSPRIWINGKPRCTRQLRLIGLKIWKPKQLRTKTLHRWLKPCFLSKYTTNW